jgi:hypothetical protein
VKEIIENFNNFLENEKKIVNTKEEVIEIIKKNPNYEIYLDNPRGTTKKFGGLDPKVLPFDYGEWPELVNPADQMGWDLVIVPSASDKDDNLTPVGFIDYNTDPSIWERVGKKMNAGIENNSKIVLAPYGWYSTNDQEVLENFFGSLIQFKPIIWF